LIDGDDVVVELMMIPNSGYIGMMLLIWWWCCCCYCLIGVAMLLLGFLWRSWTRRWRYDKGSL